MNKKIINVQVEASLKAEAEHLAERLGVPLSVVITAVLRKFIADKGVEIREYTFDFKKEKSVTEEEFEIPPFNQYVLAFKSLRDSGELKQWMVNMLKAQYNSRSHRVTSTELAKKLKYKSFVAINRWYHHIAKKVAKKMKFSYGNNIPAIVLSTFVQEKVAGSKNPQYVSTMHPEVAQALKKLEIV